MHGLHMNDVNACHSEAAMYVMSIGASWKATERMPGAVVGSHVRLVCKLDMHKEM
jgi:hypothetical protein